MTLLQNYILFLLSLASVLLATLEVGFPFDEQLPTIARQDTYYEFQINNETFITDSGDVTFEAENLPTWLSFDSSTRTFTGTPTSSDVTDALTITLVGTDSSETISRNYTMIVSSDPGPELSSSNIMFEELSTFGNTNGYNGLTLEPGESFTLNFSSSTFDIPANSSAQIVAYYGRSSDRTSLPSWIRFDESTVSFYGTAPAINSNIAPSEEFGFALIATDIEDYAGAIGTFDIIVGAHELSTTLASMTVLNGTANQTINHTIPLEEIYLDDVPIASANISSYELYGNPSWIYLSDENIVGTIPSDADSSDDCQFNFTLSDVYGNSVSVLFEVEILTSLFTVDEISPVNATRGEYFEYQLLETMFTDYDDISISATFEGDDTDWITFHESNLTFNGEVPDDLEDLTVEIDAQRSSSSTSKRSDDSDDTLSFEIKGVDYTATSSSKSHSSSSSSSSSKSSSTSSSSSSTASSTTTDSATHNGTSKSSSSHKKKILAIALGVAIPLFVLLILAICLLCFCCRRRKQREANDSEKSPSQISGPILGNAANNPNNKSDASSTETYEIQDSPRRLSTLNALKLDNKDYTDDMSDSSSMTNVEEKSIYQDALQTQSTDALVFQQQHPTQPQHAQVPRRSWRRPTPRDSVNSLDTVATEELFTVRAIDEDMKRQSAMSMFYPNQVSSSQQQQQPAARLSSSSSVLTKDSSMGNFQRLDSDGNVVAMNAPYSDNRLSSRVMSNLEVLQEENSHLHPNSTMDTSSPSEYLSVDNGNISNSNSSQHLGTSSTSTSIPDEFRARETSNGELKWDHINDSSAFDFENGNVTSSSQNNTTMQPQSATSSRYNSTMSFAPNNSNSTIIVPPGIHQVQRQSSTSSARARLVDFENQKRAYNFEPIIDQGEQSDESESAEISFMQ